MGREKGDVGALSAGISIDTRALCRQCEPDEHEEVQFACVSCPDAVAQEQYATARVWLWVWEKWQSILYILQKLLRLSWAKILRVLVVFSLTLLQQEFKWARLSHTDQEGLQILWTNNRIPSAVSARCDSNLVSLFQKSCIPKNEKTGAGLWRHKVHSLHDWHLISRTTIWNLWFGLASLSRPLIVKNLSNTASQRVEHKNSNYGILTWQAPFLPRALVILFKLTELKSLV